MLTVGLLASPTALAQTVPDSSGNVQILHNTIDGRRTMWTDDATRAPDGYLQAKGVASYTHRPLVWEWADGSTERVVGSTWQVDMIGSFSYGGVRVGMDIPLLLGADSDVFAGGGAGLGDVVLDGKVTVVDASRMPLGVALAARLGLPTATVRMPLGDDGASVELSAIADKEFGPVLLAANLGSRFSPPTQLGTETVQDQFVWRTGAGWALSEDGGLSADVAGRVGYDTPLATGAPVEAMVGGWAWLSDEVVARVGVGAGLGRAIGTPGARVLLAVGYEPPRDPDADGDGIVESHDQCPSLAEDFDGTADEDGCPDLDNDGDGVADLIDDCPDEAEDLDEYKDTDGCPEELTLLGVRVQSSTGGTAQGAWARLDCKGTQKKMSADQSTEVLPGPCTIEAGGRGYVDASIAFDVPQGPPFEQVIELQAEGEMGTLTLTVTDPEGVHIQQAAMSFDKGAWIRIHDGRGVVALTPGPHSVRLGGKGFTTATVDVEIVAEQTRDEVVVLEPQALVVTRTQIEFDDKIHFEVGLAEIRTDSLALLDDLAELLVERTDIAKVRIEDHTDGRGTPEDSLVLSQSRADAVRAYLVEQGVEADRLVALGVGQGRPIDARKGPTGWAANRRVEFHIEDRN